MAALPARRGGRNLTVLDPSREFEDIYNRMGQLVNLALGDFGMIEAGDMPWSPLADLSETNDAYVIHVEVPGVRKDQIQIQAQERELIVSGEVKDGENGRRHRSSRRTGRFEYRTLVPGDIKVDKVSAKLADGVLTVSAPKSEAAKPRQVQIAG